MNATLPVSMAPTPGTVLTSTLLAVLLSAGCRNDEFDDPQVLGGVSISAEVLNRGFAVYRKHCTGCHGAEGRGATLQREGKTPRDLTSGYYKFTSVRGDGLPTDEDLVRIIRGGLGGTQMPPFDELSDEDVLAVAHYIKTFAARWRKESVGEVIPTVEDPWTGDRTGAIERGFFVYHAVAQCWSCHPAYAPDQRILELSRTLDRDEGKTPRKSMPFRSEMGRSAAVDTRYGKVLPPDFLGDRVPAAKGRQGLYRSIAAGIGGTDMPTWFDKLSSRDLWAVVHYVRELVRLRGTPGAAKVRRGLSFPARTTSSDAPSRSPQGEREGRQK